ncbi:hypothetical protein SSTU70S_04677 [Stutzerimonas stutzeri]
MARAWALSRRVAASSVGLHRASAGSGSMHGGRATPPSAGLGQRLLSCRVGVSRVCSGAALDRLARARVACTWSAWELRRADSTRERAPRGRPQVVPARARRRRRPAAAAGCAGAGRGRRSRRTPASRALVRFAAHRRRLQAVVAQLHAAAGRHPAPQRHGQAVPGAQAALQARRGGLVQAQALVVFGLDLALGEGDDAGLGGAGCTGRRPPVRRRRRGARSPSAGIRRSPGCGRRAGCPGCRGGSGGRRMRRCPPRRAAPSPDRLR